MAGIKNDLFWRVYLVYIATVVFALLIIIRVAYLQFIEGDYWKEQARISSMKYFNIDAIRGDICAEDGRLLATSVPIYDIRMDASPELIEAKEFNEKIDSLALGLARVFKDRSSAEYKQDIQKARSGKDRYYLVKRNVSYKQLKEIRKLPLFRKGRYKGGFIVVEKSRREMPYKSLASRTIGYEREGVYVGLEGAFRKDLEGVSGKRLMQKISGGNWMPVNDENEIEPRNGNDIITTIDINIQDVAENALRKQLMSTGADYGTAILMEVSTGEIKAITNLSKTASGNYDELFNYAVGESTEPGSTFKLLSMIVALEEGVIRPEAMINTGNGRYRFSDRVMVDSKEEGYGRISAQEVFEVSSNVGMSKIIYDAFQKNPAKFIERLKAMGIDRPLDIEISGEGQPYLTEPGTKAWSGVSLPWMAIGYGVSMTPLQILTYYNAVANDGCLVKPMFVKEVKHTGKTIKKYETQILNNSICSKGTLEIVKEMLIGVVEEGTAQNIKNPVYKIAGKTGTAQIANSKYGYRTSSGRTYRASFAGFFPADNPKYSCIVVINNPTGYSYYGSQVAAPVFKEIADKVFATSLDLHTTEFLDSAKQSLPTVPVGSLQDALAIYNMFDCEIQTDGSSEWVRSVVSGDTVRLRAREIKENLVPNVVGMGLRDALYLLENSGMKVRFSGRGIVRKQSISPGTRILPNGTIYIELS